MHTQPDRHRIRLPVWTREGSKHRIFLEPKPTLYLSFYYVLPIATMAFQFHPDLLSDRFEVTVMPPLQPAGQQLERLKYHEWGSSNAMSAAGWNKIVLEIGPEVCRPFMSSPPPCHMHTQEAMWVVVWELQVNENLVEEGYWSVTFSRKYVFWLEIRFLL